MAWHGTALRSVRVQPVRPPSALPHAHAHAHARPDANHGAQATASDGTRRQRPTAPLCEHVGDQPERLARVDRPAPVRVVPPEKPLHAYLVRRLT
jgi:hypothetical protein